MFQTRPLLLQKTMSQAGILLVALCLVKLALADVLTACEQGTCSCSSYEGRTAKNIRCPNIVNCTVNIEYEPSEHLEIQCLSNSTFVDELEFDFARVKVVRIQDCKLPRGLNVFERWHLTGVRELILKRIFDLGTNGTIRNDFFDRTPKGSIERLHIKECGLRAVQEEAFKGFDNLTRLDFEGNELTEVPDIFKHIPSLLELDMQRNRIRALPDGITAPNLRTLYLNMNDITSLNKIMFERTPNLTLLELSANRISHLPQDLLRPLKKLHSINFGLAGEVNVTELFDKNEKLAHVRFRGGHITSISPEAFSNLTNLQKLDIYDSKLRVLPKDLFTYTKNIETIKLSENGLTELPEGIFENLNKLKTLDLSSNGLIEWKKEYFQKGLHSLKELRLDRNKLEQIASSVFTDLPQLNKLSLNNNRIRDISREAFDKQSSITHLNLNVNSLYTDDGDSFNFLTNLVRLEVNNNTYSEVPHVNHIPTLKILNMRNNKMDNLLVGEVLGIKELDLTGNLIETVNLQYLDIILTNETAPSRSTLILNRNPLSCNCTAYDLFQWIGRDDPRLRIVADNLDCASPPELRQRSVQDVTPKDLKCDLRMLQAAVNKRYECPGRCECTVFPANATLHVDCAGLNLTTAPDIDAFEGFFAYGIKYKNFTVDLSRNEIREFTAKLNYTNVTGLDLSRNNLRLIKWVPQNVKVIKLHANKLSGIDYKVLSTLTNNTRLESLSLHGNPWTCNCSLVNLTNAVRVTFRNLLQHSEKVQCETGQLLIHKTKAELCIEDQTLTIALSVVLAVLVTLFIVSLIFYYKYETTVKIWLFSHRIFFVTEDEIDKKKKFDAFVSYSHKDEGFVEQHLLPELEGGPNPYRICYHERDWEVGEYINQQIIDSVANSRRTIIVLSKNFLESTWGAMEFQAAHAQAMNEKWNRLVVILYDEVKPEDVQDDALRAYLRTNTYIKWGDPWFWKKLRYAMPRRNVADAKTEKAKQRIENIMISIDDKLDLTTIPTTPNTQTPPAMSLDPLLLKVSPLEFKSEKGENRIIATQIC